MERVLIYCLLLFILACANPVRPTGGPRDTTPPRLDTLNSSPLQQTQFHGRSLSFTFDEYVVIHNPAKELLISPPLEHLPELDAHGKTVTLTFNEQDTLRENTTYSIQFNNVIQDLHEGNPIENLIVVFSTGNKIDSNAITVHVIDNLTEKPIENIYVMLYKNLDDSVVYREKPYYVTMSNSAGVATLRNLGEGTYKLFALQDQNLNLFYDISSERIGFLPADIVIPGKQDEYTIKMFLPEQQTALLDWNCFPYGKCVFIFNKAPDAYSLSSLRSNVILVSYPHNDSLILWRKNDLEGEVKILLDSAGHVTDTITMRLKKIDSLLLVKRAFISDRLKKVRINPVKGEKIKLLRPVREIKQEGIILLDSSGVAADIRISIDSIILTELHLFADREGKYTLFLKPNSLIDLYGQGNRDTIMLDVEVGSIDKLSTIIIKVIGLDSSQQYLLRLLRDKNLIDQTLITGVDSTGIEYPGMKDDNYTLKLISDSNFNGKYDKGSYSSKQQPESIVIKKIEGMRPSWDIQSIISPKKMKNDTTQSRSR